MSSDTGMKADFDGIDDSLNVLNQVIEQIQSEILAPIAARMGNVDSIWKGSGAGKYLEYVETEVNGTLGQYQEQSSSLHSMISSARDTFTEAADQVNTLGESFIDDTNS